MRRLKLQRLQALSFFFALSGDKLRVYIYK